MRSYAELISLWDRIDGYIRKLGIRESDNV